MSGGGISPLFLFVQFEFPFELGPAAGRYVVRDHGDEEALRVLVLTVLGAEQRRALRGRKRGPASPDPVAVTTWRATVVRGRPAADEAEGKAFMRSPEPRVVADLAVVNRVIGLHRVASADPSVREVARSQALVVRAGYGEGEQVAEGRWTEAAEVRPPRAARRGRREAALRPQERLAALLGGRDAALAAEELVLRARADLDAGRLREAALQLRIALEAALAELEPWRDRADLAERIEALREERGVVGDTANAALRAGLDDAAAEDVERVVSHIEAALRARTAGGID